MQRTDPFRLLRRATGVTGLLILASCSPAPVRQDTPIMERPSLEPSDQAWAARDALVFKDGSRQIVSFIGRGREVVAVRDLQGYYRIYEWVQLAGYQRGFLPAPGIVTLVSGETIRGEIRLADERGLEVNLPGSPTAAAGAGIKRIAWGQIRSYSIEAGEPLEKSAPD